jgi:hypothetical protein
MPELDVVRKFETILTHWLGANKVQVPGFPQAVQINSLSVGWRPRQTGGNFAARNALQAHIAPCLPGCPDEGGRPYQALAGESEYPLPEDAEPRHAPFEVGACQGLAESLPSRVGHPPG